MSWYVIQTYTGREEQLVEMIHRIVPPDHYGECFVIYSEQLRHRQQENQIHVLRLFPGYIFISSNHIEQLFRYLKKVPAMSKIMASDDFTFTPLWDKEAEFLFSIMDESHIVRLSYVATDGRDRVTYLAGPLENCREQIQSYRFRKRYAAVRLTLEGREKEVKLGIILNDDVRRELEYGKVEAPVEKPEKYMIPITEQRAGNMCTARQEVRSGDLAGESTGGADGKDQGESSICGSAGQKCIPQFAPGDRVLVMEGVFEGSTAIVSQVKKDMLMISTQMFGREIPVEVPAECVNKIK